MRGTFLCVATVAVFCIALIANGQPTHSKIHATFDVPPFESDQGLLVPIPSATMWVAGRDSDADSIRATLDLTLGSVSRIQSVIVYRLADKDGSSDQIKIVDSKLIAENLQAGGENKVTRISFDSQPEFVDELMSEPESFLISIQADEVEPMQARWRGESHASPIQHLVGS